MELTFANDRLKTFLPSRVPLSIALSLGAFLLDAANLWEMHLCLPLSHLISAVLGRWEVREPGGRESALGCNGSHMQTCSPSSHILLPPNYGMHS